MPLMVGMGWTGSIVARELTKAGLTVVGLERGEDLTPGEHFALPNIRDELNTPIDWSSFKDPALETLTFRHRPRTGVAHAADGFLPSRQQRRRRRQSLGGLHWRYLPSDHLCAAISRGATGQGHPEDMTIQDGR